VPGALVMTAPRVLMSFSPVADPSVAADHSGLAG
jgi:hypothetical protein